MRPVSEGACVGLYVVGMVLVIPALVCFALAELLFPLEWQHHP